MGLTFGLPILVIGLWILPWNARLRVRKEDMSATVQWRFYLWAFAERTAFRRMYEIVEGYGHHVRIVELRDRRRTVEGAVVGMAMPEFVRIANAFFGDKAYDPH